MAILNTTTTVSRGSRLPMATGARTRTFMAVQAAVLTLLILTLTGCSSTEPLPGAAVHGYAVADLGKLGIEKRGSVALPDITAFLRNPLDGNESPRVASDLKGLFMIPRQAAGTYELCLEAPGFQTTCSTAVTLKRDIEFVGEIPIAAIGNALIGEVMLEKGGPCHHQDASLGIDFSTVLRTRNGSATGHLGRGVRANLAGQYLLPDVPPGRLEVEAQCQKARRVELVQSQGAVQEAHLALPNKAPAEMILEATEGDRAVRRVAPGATVVIQANAFDPDGDGLEYRWAASGGSTPIFAADSSTVRWTLPDTPGQFSIFATALDGKGGIAKQTLRISSGDEGLYFSGTVTKVDGSALADAEITLNGESSRTNAEGGFALRAKDEAARYVLTIRKTGFQTLCKVFDAGVLGGRYSMVPMQVAEIDPSDGGELQEEKKGRLPGAEVVIRPGTLELEGGGAPALPVRGMLASIDLSDPEDRFPGEYAAINRRGQEVALNSLGAVEVSFFDANDQKVNLAPDTTALVRIPVDSGQLGMPEMPGKPPESIAIWFLNPATGLWEEEGRGILKGDFYEAEVSHFSVINADIEFTTPACMRIRTDIARLPLPYQLRVSAPANAPVKTVTKTVADQLSVVVRLPQNTAIRLEVLDSSGNVISQATQVKNTGATSSPASPSFDQYSTCTSEALITLDSPSRGGMLDFYLNDSEAADTYYSKIDPVEVSGAGSVSSSGVIVTGSGTQFTSFIEAGHILKSGGKVRLVTEVVSDTELKTESAFNPVLSNVGYSRVGERPTLAAWKQKNGFPAVGGDAEAVFLNAGDLNFGRWMRMKRSGGNIAYYVSNHGLAPNFGSVDLAVLGKLNNQPDLGLIATVAMEYSPNPNDSTPSKYTKFYVYNGQGVRVNKAALDSAVGEKYIPNLCIICHGGSPATTASDPRGDGGSRFIFFDPESYGYSGLDTAHSQASQEPAFYNLNQSVKNDTNVTPAVSDLITRWYQPNLPAADQSQDATVVPPAWAPQASLYSNVVKPACRACHTTRTNYVSWDSWDVANSTNDFKGQGSTIRSYVCGPNRIMPHAEITYERKFWLTPAGPPGTSIPVHAPAALAAAGLDDWPATAPCPCKLATDTSAENAGLPDCP
ncbi:MAG: carboxypeptidase-like regulatory domain-containing protein [Deltaproteobacteria bacterium]|nr:carboxypeptidase-like regulatory domain-containing protein [Deltaproteobacteria bacterium]